MGAMSVALAEAHSTAVGAGPLVGGVAVLVALQLVVLWSYRGRSTQGLPFAPRRRLRGIARRLRVVMSR